MSTEPTPELTSDQLRDLLAAAAEARAVLRDLLRDRATGKHYSRVNQACWRLTAALPGAGPEDAGTVDAQGG